MTIKQTEGFKIIKHNGRYFYVIGAVLYEEKLKGLEKIQDNVNRLTDALSQIVAA